MTTRPTVPTNFADGASANKAAIPAGIRTDGYPFGSALPSSLYDQREYEVGLWLEFFAGMFPDDQVLSAGRILGTEDPEDSSRALTITTLLESKVIEILASTNESGLVWRVTGGASTAGWTADRDTGAMTGVGTVLNVASLPLQDVTAMTGLVSGLRYAFDSSESLLIDISPQSGGWSVQHATTGSSYNYIAGANAATSPLVGSSKVTLQGATVPGDCWRRPLVEVESSAGRSASSPVWIATDIDLTVVVASNGPVRIRLCQRDRSTGAESAFGSFVVQSNTSPTGQHTFSYSEAGTALDLETYSYFLEMDVTDNNASSQDIVSAHLRLVKGAAD